MKFLPMYWKVVAALALLSVSNVRTIAAAIQVGDDIPAGAHLHFGFPPEKINLKDRVAGKKVILVGLPGAFTPT